MRRVVILGRGGAGKSTLAVRLGAALALPVIELDKHFWTPDLTPTPKDRWAQIQRQLTSSNQWVMDGDLGPYDVLDVRLQAADTVIVLDFPLWRCAWRALRRSRENLAFWRWLITYRHRSLPTVMAAIASTADRAELHVLRSPRAVEQLLTRASTAGPSDHPRNGGVGHQRVAGQAPDRDAQRANPCHIRPPATPSGSRGLGRRAAGATPNPPAQPPPGRIRPAATL